MKPAQLKADIPTPLTEGMQLLVAELIKKRPDQGKVKQLAKQTGVQYFDNPIEMLNTVLLSIDQLTKRSRTRRKVHETSL